MRETPVLTRGSLLRNPCPKRTGVLEHCREGQTDCCFPIFGEFPSGRIPKATKDVSELFLAIPVRYTSEFQERLEATVYILSHCKLTALNVT
jgi:hypothetical protein